MTKPVWSADDCGSSSVVVPSLADARVERPLAAPVPGSSADDAGPGVPRDLVDFGAIGHANDFFRRPSEKLMRFPIFGWFLDDFRRRNEILVDRLEGKV
jgi:hypothetical protein